MRECINCKKEIEENDFHVSLTFCHVEKVVSLSNIDLRDHPILIFCSSRCHFAHILITLTGMNDINIPIVNESWMPVIAQLAREIDRSRI